MGTTTTGLPYPEPGDPVAAGADNIKALANAVDVGPRGLLGSAWSSTVQAGIQQAQTTITGTTVNFTVPGSTSRAVLITSQIRWAKAVGDSTGEVVHRLVRDPGAVVLYFTQIRLVDGTVGFTIVTSLLTTLAPGAYTISSKGNTTIGFVNAEERLTTVIDVGP